MLNHIVGSADPESERPPASLQVFGDGPKVRPCPHHVGIVPVAERVRQLELLPEGVDLDLPGVTKVLDVLTVSQVEPL
jgi:hypothetical protein